MLDRQFVYFPEPWEERDWSALSGLPLEEARFRAADGPRLFGWFLPARGSPGVLLWSHGNAGNILHRLDNLAQLHRHGLSVLLYDYRGYGRSEGEPSEEGLYLDAQAAHDWLVKERGIAPARIVAYGRSLGAAVAGDLALRRPVAGLILENAFPSVEAVARRSFRGLPAHLFVKARFELVRRLPELRVPVLVLHAERDTVIPFELGRQVYEAAREPKEFVPIPGAGHNDTYQVSGEEYFRALSDFTRRVTA